MEDLISLDLLLRARAEGLANIQQAQNLLMGLGKAAIAIGAIGAGAITAFAVSATNNFIQTGESLTRLSERFGVSVTSMSKWVEAGKYFGVTQDQITGAFQRLSTRMGQMELAFKATGKLPKQLAEQFKELGVHLTDVHGHFRNLNDVMLDTFDRLGKMTDVEERNRIAMMLLGGSGAQMIEMFKAGKIGIQDMMNQAQKMGAVMTDDMAAKTMKYVEVQRQMQVAMDGIKQTMAMAMLPIFQKVAAFISGPGIDAFRAVAGWLSTHIPKAVTIVLGAFNGLMNSGLVSWLKTKLPEALSAAEKGFGALSKGFQSVLSFGSGVVTGNIDLGKAFQNVDTKSLGKTLGGAFKEAFKTIFSGLDKVADSVNWIGIGKTVAGKAVEFVLGFVETLFSPDLWINLVTHHLGDVLSVAMVVLPLGRVVGGLVGRLIPGIGPVLARGLVSLSSKIEEGLGTAFRESVKFLLTVLFNIVKALVTGFIKAFGVEAKVIPGAFKKLWEDVIITIWAFLEKFALFGLKIVQAIGGAVGQAFKAVFVTPFVELWKAIWDVLPDLGKKFLEFGGNIVKGIWDGIRGAWDWLVSRFTDLLKKLPGPLQKVLGIASPSAVFADMVGMPIAMGIHQGITKGARNIQDALKSATTPGSVGSGISGSSFGGVSSPAQQQLVLQKLDAIYQTLIAANSWAQAIAAKDLTPSVKKAIQQEWAQGRA